MIILIFQISRQIVVDLVPINEEVGEVKVFTVVFVLLLNVLEAALIPVHLVVVREDRLTPSLAKHHLAVQIVAHKLRPGLIYLVNKKNIS